MRLRNFRMALSLLLMLVLSSFIISLTSLPDLAPNEIPAIPSSFHFLAENLSQPTSPELDRHSVDWEMDLLIQGLYPDPEDDFFAKSCQSQGRALTVYHAWNVWTFVQTSNRGCSSWCRLTEDQETASLVVFHVPSTSRPGPRFPQQQVGGWSMEPRLGIGFYAWEMSWTANMAMTYNLDSNLPVLYIPPDFWKKVTSIPIPSKEEFERRKTMIWVSSRCVPQRTEYVRELMNYIDIESRGECLNNAEKVPKGHESLVLPFYEKYKFVLGVEKFNDQDYITEKFFYPFMAGAVPVYAGPETAHFFAPAKHSFIWADKYPSVQELATHLKDLASNYEKWVEYFKWKVDPVKPRGYGRLEAKSALAPNVLCRICNCACNATCSSGSRGGEGVSSYMKQFWKNVEE